MHDWMTTGTANNVPTPYQRPTMWVFLTMPCVWARTLLSCAISTASLPTSALPRLPSNMVKRRGTLTFGLCPSTRDRACSTRMKSSFKWGPWCHWCRDGGTTPSCVCFTLWKRLRSWRRNGHEFVICCWICVWMLKLRSVLCLPCRGGMGVLVVRTCHCSGDFSNFYFVFFLLFSFW